MLGNWNLGSASDQAETWSVSTSLAPASPHLPHALPLLTEKSVSGVASVFPTLHLQRVSSLRPQTDFEAERGRAVWRTSSSPHHLRGIGNKQRLRIGVTLSHLLHFYLIYLFAVDAILKLWDIMLGINVPIVQLITILITKFENTKQCSISGRLIEHRPALRANSLLIPYNYTVNAVNIFLLFPVSLKTSLSKCSKYHWFV